MAQVTPSTEEHEGALRKCEKKKTWEGDDGVDGGGVDGFDGVDGGLGSSTQRALTWKFLCVPSGEDDTHSSSFVLCLN